METRPSVIARLLSIRYSFEDVVWPFPYFFSQKMRCSAGNAESADDEGNLYTSTPLDVVEYAAPISRCGPSVRIDKPIIVVDIFLTPQRNAQMLMNVFQTLPKRFFFLFFRVRERINELLVSCYHQNLMNNEPMPSTRQAMEEYGRLYVEVVWE